MRSRVAIIALAALVFGLLAATLTGCPDTPSPIERDPGRVTQVVTGPDGQVTVYVKRDSNGTGFDAGPYGGTACRVGDHWPECH